MANIIDSLGADFINKRFMHAMFLKDNHVYRVAMCQDGAVLCRNIDKNEDLHIPKEFFTGFKVFAYPKLGYRRLGKHYVGFGVKEQSAMRGLSFERVDFHPSQATGVLAKLGLAKADGNKERMLQIMRPTFDKLDSLKELYDGKRSNVVLNESLIVEPSTKEVDGQFDIFYDQVRVGAADDAGKIKWTTPKYERHIKPMLGL